ncbi:hypothetical protein THAOC_23610, partial [Thalassiosira oceanica]
PRPRRPHRGPREQGQAQDRPPDTHGDGDHVADRDEEEDPRGRQGAEAWEAPPGTAESHHVRRHREADHGAPARGERRRERGALLQPPDEGGQSRPRGEQSEGEGRARPVLQPGPRRGARTELEGYIQGTEQRYAQLVRRGGQPECGGSAVIIRWEGVAEDGQHLGTYIC